MKGYLINVVSEQNLRRGYLWFGSIFTYVCPLTYLHMYSIKDEIPIPITSFVSSNLRTEITRFIYKYEKGRIVKRVDFLRSFCFFSAETKNVRTVFNLSIVSCYVLLWNLKCVVTFHIFSKVDLIGFLFICWRSLSSPLIVRMVKCLLL